MGRITITDLARITGYSKTTISHVLNDKSGARIRPETRDLIREAAREHNYVPNFFARHIIRGRARSLGFLTHSLRESGRNGLLVGAETAARAGGYHLIVIHADPDQSEAEIIQSIIERGIEGLFADWLERPAEARERLRDFGIQLTLGCGPGGGDIDAVFDDLDSGCGRLIETLKRLGHRCAALLKDPNGGATTLSGAVGDAMRTAGLAVVEQRPEDRRALAGHALLNPNGHADPPTVAICDSPRLALGLLTQALSRGRRVPEDFSIVSLGCPEPFGFEQPALACLRLASESLGGLAVERLIECVEAALSRDELGAGDSPPCQSRAIEPELIMGQTLGPAPEK